MKITGCFFSSLSFVYVFRNTLQGIGYSKAAMGSGLSEMIARIAVSLLLVPAFGFPGALFASPAAWVCADLFLLPMYFYAVRRLEKRKACEGAADKG